MNFGKEFGLPNTAFNIFEQTSSNFEGFNCSRQKMNMGNSQGVPTTIFNIYQNGKSSNDDFVEQSESSSSDSEGIDMSNNHGVPTTIFNESGRNYHRTSYEQFKSSSPDSESDCDVETVNIKSFGSSGHNVMRQDERSSFTDFKMTLETIEKIEKDVGFNDMISLIFLLFESDKTSLALQEISSMIKNYQVNGPRNIATDKLSSWARNQVSNKCKNWKMKLVEALALIQNYRILNKLGYNQLEVDKQFEPQNNETQFLNKGKKMLFILCDSLSIDQAMQLITSVRAEVKFDNDITLGCDGVNMELHVLYWLTQNVITIDKEVNISILTKYLKTMNFSDLVRIEEMVKIINEELQNKCSPEEKDMYNIINPNNVGLLIIVNMVEFEKNIERRAEFQDQLPDYKLEDRIGSFQDVLSLKSTFQYHLKFQVVIEDDIKHDDLIYEIKKMIKEHFVKGEHSALFVCLMSHGKEGSIYAVNSVPVSIDEIKNIFFEDSLVANLLVDVPKALIIQACQGMNHLYVESTMTTDSGGSREKQFGRGQIRLEGPMRQDPYSDLIICMSIIDGFVSVRSKIKGSKYIQELCHCLKKYHEKKHFTDIVVRVQKNINKQDMHVTVPPEYSRCTEHKNCMNIYMTPWICWNTLRKDLYVTLPVDV